MDNTYREIGERLRKLRKLHGFTQKNLAGVIGVTFQQVQKYEKGHNKISVDKLQAISDYFQIPTSYFTDIEGKNDSQEGGIDQKIHQLELDRLAKHFFAIEDEEMRKSLLFLVKSISEKETK